MEIKKQSLFDRVDAQLQADPYSLTDLVREDLGALHLIMVSATGLEESAYNLLYVDPTLLSVQDVERMKESLRRKDKNTGLQDTSVFTSTESKLVCEYINKPSLETRVKLCLYNLFYFGFFANLPEAEQIQILEAIKAKRGNKIDPDELTDLCRTYKAAMPLKVLSFMLDLRGSDFVMHGIFDDVTKLRLIELNPNNFDYFYNPTIEHYLAAKEAGYSGPAEQYFSAGADDFKSRSPEFIAAYRQYETAARVGETLKG